MEKQKQIELIEDVKEGPLLSAYVEAPFDLAKEALESKSYSIASIEQIAQLAMNKRSYGSVYNDSHFTKEAFIYVPKKGIFLTKNSPIMENAKRATELSGRLADFGLPAFLGFPLSSEEVEKALKNSCQIIHRTIPSLKLSEEELGAYLFGKIAKEYGQFLQYQVIDNVEFLCENMNAERGEPFAKQVFLERINQDYPYIIDGSKKSREHTLCGYWAEGFGLDRPHRVRGVKINLNEKLKGDK